MEAQEALYINGTNSWKLQRKYIQQSGCGTLMSGTKYYSTDEFNVLSYLEWLFTGKCPYNSLTVHKITCNNKNMSLITLQTTFTKNASLQVDDIIYYLDKSTSPESGKKNRARTNYC